MFGILLVLLVSARCTQEQPNYETVMDLMKSVGVSDLKSDSTLLLFTSVNQCSPCNTEIMEWDRYSRSENSSLNIIMIVSERFTRNFEAYQNSNSYAFLTVQDSANIFRNENIIPFLPYKLLLTDGRAIDLGELGNMKLLPYPVSE